MCGSLQVSQANLIIFFLFNFVLFLVFMDGPTWVCHVSWAAILSCLSKQKNYYLDDSRLDETITMLYHISIFHYTICISLNVFNFL